MASPAIPALGLQNNETDLTLSGRGFIYSSAAAGVVAAAASTSSPMMLWNPSDSGVNLRILEVRIGAVSGTVITSHLGYGFLTGAGAQVGTAQPIVSATFANPVNLLISGGKASRVKFAPATVSLTAAPTYLMTSGMSAGGALAAGPVFELVDFFQNGKIIVPPGVAFFAFVSNAAMALTASIAVIGVEEPIPVTGNY